MKTTTTTATNEYAEGYESATREIKGEQMTPSCAQRYLDLVAPRENDAFDAGFTAAMRAHASLRHDFR